MKRKYNSDFDEVNLHFKCLLMAFSCVILVSYSSNNQQVQINEYQLNLVNTGRTIENSISLYTTRFDYEAIHDTTGEKTRVKVLKLIINGDTLNTGEIYTRGQSTLHYRRKSFSFNLDSKALFSHGVKTDSLRKFILLSLAMDRNYCNNRLAYEMMEVSKLFGLFYSFCELRINGQSEGIHMVIERPENWAIKIKHTPLLIRRGYNHAIDKIIMGKEISKGDEGRYCDQYRQIYRCLNKYEGEQLYNALSGHLDVEVYMKWLAFNFLIQNGDYTDEVYFYFDPGLNKFSIIPWDYDDLFFPSPHEGNVESRRILGDKLIFSAEDILDRKIAEDPYLYKIYLIQLGEVLTRLSPSVLKRIFENTYSELYPYYSNEEIIDLSKYDAYKNAGLVKLQNNMSVFYRQLVISRDHYLNYLRSKI
jgi:spore coat protein H